MAYRWTLLMFLTVTACGFWFLTGSGDGAGEPQAAQPDVLVISLLTDDGSPQQTLVVGRPVQLLAMWHHGGSALNVTQKNPTWNLAPPESGTISAKGEWICRRPGKVRLFAEFNGSRSDTLQYDVWHAPPPPPCEDEE